MDIKPINYKPYLHKPPIVWLDTNIIIGIRESQSNFSKQKPEDRDKFNRLYKFLKEKVKENKIVCPFSGQRTEYSDGDHIKASDDILMSLSKGFQVSQWQIRHIQVKRMLECFLSKERQFFFSDSDLVYKKEEHEARESEYPFRVVILNEKSKKSSKEFLFHDLIRRKTEVKKLGLTYKQVYKSEYDAAILVLQKSINKIIEDYGYLKTDFTLDDEEYHHLYTVVELSKLVNTTDDKILIKLLKDFFISEYFYSIPIDRISSTIIAHIMTEGEKVTQNDIGDNNNLSSIFPYASYIITERRMAHILTTRKLDIEFGVKIFRINEIDNFIETLKNKF